MSIRYNQGDTLVASYGTRLRVKHDVLLSTPWDAELAQYVGQIPEAGVWECNETLRGLEAAVTESLFACWRLYGCESDERLAEDAKKVKRWVLKHFAAI